MTKINLLPWREDLRKRLNQVFLVVLAKNIALTLVIVIMIDQFISYRIEGDNVDIAYINKELQRMTPRVNEIQALLKKRKLLLDRINVIQSLQEDRFSIVRLLDLIPRTLPDGVFLTEFSRKMEDANNPDAGKNKMAKAPPAAANRKGAVKETAVEVKRIRYFVNIQGVSLSNTNIAVFLQNLEKIRWLSDVKLTEVSINKSGIGLAFKIEFYQNLNVKE